MANDTDITIGMKTDGADAAANELIKVSDAVGEIPVSAPDAVTAIDSIGGSLDDVAGKAKRLQDELDVVEAKRRVAAREQTAQRGGLGIDISDIAARGGEELANKVGFGKEFQAISKLLSADLMAVGASIALIGKAAVESYQFLDATAERFVKLRELGKETGQALGPDLEDQLANLQATLAPIKGVVDEISGAWTTLIAHIKDPVGELSGANQLEASMRRAAEQAEKLKQARLAAMDGTQARVASYYAEELKTLIQQEEVMKRISAHRNQMNTLAVQAANQEVDYAKKYGGDVELAQANALAAEMQAGLVRLSDSVADAASKAKIAERQSAEATSLMENAQRENMDALDPARFEELKIAAAKAEDAAAAAQQALNEQDQIYQRSKTELLRGIELNLADLDTGSQGVVNDAADKVRKGIHNTIIQEFSNIGEPAGEVKSAIDAARTQTITAIKQLAPQAQDTAQVTNAVQDVGKGLAEQSNAVIASLAAVSSGIGQITQKIQSQQNQINQLYQRLR